MEKSDEKCREEITNSVWAFRPGFLANLTDLPEQVFASLSVLCESANDAIVKLIEKTCGLDHLVSEAISSDGRGHFLAHYDHEEHEIQINGETYFLYRSN